MLENLIIVLGLAAFFGAFYWGLDKTPAPPPSMHKPTSFQTFIAIAIGAPIRLIGWLTAVALLGALVWFAVKLFLIVVSH